MQVKTFVFNPYRQCTYVVYEADKAIIIDAGMYSQEEQERFQAFLSSSGLTPIALLITHTHPDHVCGLDWLRATYRLEPTIFPQEGDLSIPQASAFRFRVLRTPGHKEDCVCYLLTPPQNSTQPSAILFSGDTLFCESIGRTDLPGGDMNTLLHSLQRIATLPAHTQVLPGHGEPTTIEHELRYNPWMRKL